jgi:hypothetical protein
MSAADLIRLESDVRSRLDATVTKVQEAMQLQEAARVQDRVSVACEGEYV